MKNYKKIASSFLCSLTLTLSILPFSTTALESSYPDSYDARKEYLTELEPKNQLISGPCWAFASIATLEGYLSKNGMLRESLSEKHLLNWANRNDEPGWKRYITDGGLDLISLGYLTSGDGPVLSQQCPFNYTNDHWNDQRIIKPSFSVRGIKYLTPEIDEIKDAIVKYGAVYADSLNHAVSIIGWINPLSRWMAKDSNIHKPYILIPFSTKLHNLYCITDAKKYDDREKIYQYDKFGANSYLPSVDDYIIAANTFEMGAGEILDSVMVESNAKGANIKIYCTDTLSDGTPNSDQRYWQELYSGQVPYNGYYTYNLSKKLQSPYKKTAIIVYIKSNHNQKATIGAQTSDQFLNTENSQSSFILYDVGFLRIPTDFSIKAITKK